MAKSERVAASIEEVFADDPEFLADLKGIRDAAREGAHFVKKLRASAGLTQRQLAARLGISQPRVSAMERGAGPEGPSYVMLKRVAAACGVPWSLETGLGSGLQRRKPESEAALNGGAGSDTFVVQAGSDTLLTVGADSDTFVVEVGSAIFVVEEVLQANAPRALRPAEIRSAIQRDKGVAMAFISIRNALGQLEARHVVEQVTEGKAWRYRSGRGGSASLRRDRTT